MNSTNLKQCDNPKCRDYHGQVTPEGKTHLIQKLPGENEVLEYNQYKLPNGLIVTYCPSCEAAVDFLKQCGQQTNKTKL